jgi:hypothetical protein
MPDTITISGISNCSSCSNGGYHTTATCQWGVVPGKEYNIGDAVEWLREDGIAVPPFSVRASASGTWVWNSGDPSYLNVLLLDIPTFGSDTIGTCSHCGVRHTAIAAKVINGIFVELLSLTRRDYIRVFGIFPAQADVALINLDGTYTPRPDWFDHTLDLAAVTKA